MSTDGSQTQVLLLCCYQTTFHLFIYQTQTHADIADVLTSTPHDYLCEPFSFLTDLRKWNNLPSVPLCCVLFLLACSQPQHKYLSKHVVHQLKRTVLMDVRVICPELKTQQKLLTMSYDDALQSWISHLMTATFGAVIAQCKSVRKSAWKLTATTSNW